MGQANCCCGSRWAPPAARGHAGTARPHTDDGLPHARRSLLCREALSEAEAVLSADVRLTRGRKRSERRLLLLQEEVVVAKLQCGTTLRPQLRLALDQLWVLSGGKEAAGEEEEQGSDEDRTSLIFVWPTGSCIATFGSRALKELWLGTLLGTPEGGKRARVTRLPSLTLLEKELRCRHAVSVSLWCGLGPRALVLQLSSRGIAAHLLALLLSCPVEDVQHQEPGEADEGPGRGENGCLLPASGCAGVPGTCGEWGELVREGGREGGSRGATWGAERVGEPPGTPARPRWQRWEESCRAGQRAREGRGSKLCHAQAAGAGWQLAGGPFCCGAALLSAAWFLQADAKRGPPRVSSSTGGGLCRSAAPGQSGSGCSRPLFGQPLAALCGEDGTLPRPLQELLAVLQQEGPSTEGIFRRAASGTAVRELKEALDCGADVDLGSQPALLLAVVLKDFLRSIPSKLLANNLYEDWMAAMQKSSKEEKISELKAVAEKLPAPNLLLLKRLLSLLQHIGRTAATSRMTCSNLAICVGPNLLSPPNEELLPLPAMLEVTDKVKVLVEFMVENCRELFGEETRELSRPAAEESPAPTERCGHLRLEEQSGPALTADTEHRAEALLHAPPSLPGVLEGAGGDTVAESETRE
ncbi:PREDICTED: uncharacterized protein LOC104019300, partial [Nipponia nippon]|uniref:uncharacterized protein LOC104019300 n=1 Tax=Nipponia nippon TaxID=128390 RepID=UPI000511779F